MSKKQLSLEIIQRAHELIAPLIAPSPLTHSSFFTDTQKMNIHFKWDNRLRSGSFKERGALHFLLQLSEEQRKRGVCAASAGNHAYGLSMNAARLGVPCTIVMPRFSPLIKVESNESTGATVLLEGDVFQDSLAYAQEYAEINDLEFVHAYDDYNIMAGQGTCGLEILDQCPNCDAVIVPVGGGGLISGVATAIKALRPDVYVIGVQSEWAVKRERPKTPFTSRVTLADGIAVKQLGKKTSKIIKETVDKMVTVTEGEISEAIIHFLEREKAVVEGGGAAGLPVLLRGELPKKCKTPVVLVSGGNIDIELISTVIRRGLIKRGRWVKFTTSVVDRPGLLEHLASVIAHNGANILDVHHERFSVEPGLVQMTFSLEVRNQEHAGRVEKALKACGIKVSPFE